MTGKIPGTELLRMLVRHFRRGGIVLIFVFAASLGVDEVWQFSDSLQLRLTQSVAMASDTVEGGDDSNIRVFSPIPGIDELEARFPDQSLWSEGRKTAFSASLSMPVGPVLGVFEIPRLNLELPIYDGASDLHMDRGIGRIEGTAHPGHESGNLGIAGHRDGFFRILKDIELGDEIMVMTGSSAQTFVVEETMIVDPGAVEVLEHTDAVSVTLVTCYPFYFVGHAPERFIVRAVLRDKK